MAGACQPSISFLVLSLFSLLEGKVFKIPVTLSALVDSSSAISSGIFSGGTDKEFCVIEEGVLLTFLVWFCTEILTSIIDSPKYSTGCAL